MRIRPLPAAGRRGPLAPPDAEIGPSFRRSVGIFTSSVRIRRAPATQHGGHTHGLAGRHTVAVHRQALQGGGLATGVMVTESRTRRIGTWPNGLVLRGQQLVQVTQGGASKPLGSK